jgi:Fic family protein
LRGELNERQEKALKRMFREGIDGFEGGLSAENYISITKATRATATRDLQDLVKKGALVRTGQLRHTRYHLNIPEQSWWTSIPDPSHGLKVVGSNPIRATK